MIDDKTYVYDEKEAARITKYWVKTWRIAEWLYNNYGTSEGCTLKFDDLERIEKLPWYRAAEELVKVYVKACVYVETKPYAYMRLSNITIPDNPEFDDKGKLIEPKEKDDV